jgi:Tfp pilus assembly major pilin PilA
MIGIISLSTVIYLPYNVDSEKANNLSDVKADIECTTEDIRPYLNSNIKGICHGYDKKLDTCGSP